MTPREYITTLAKSFPCIRRLVPEPWDVQKFMAPINVVSTGERHAMLFVASVWNPGYAAEEGWRFDAIDALTSWDSANRAAFIAWAQKPYLP